MQKKNINILIGLAVVLALISGGWYLAEHQKGSVGPKARAELALLGYNSLSDIGTLSTNIANGEKFVKDIENALVVLDKIGVEEEDIVEAHLTIAVGLNVLKNPDGAMKEYEEVLKINSKHSISLNNLAQISLEKKEYAKAEEYYKQLIVASPTWFQAYTDLADLYRAYIPEKKSEAPAIILQGLKQSPKNTGFMVYLGDLYASNGDKKNAAAQYRNVLKIDPNNMDVKDALARMIK